MDAPDHLTVLLDPRCSVCARTRAWLEAQPLLVGLEFLASGGEEARRRYPELSPVGASEDLTVVGDGGQVWTGDDAWSVALWATADWRERLVEHVQRGEPSYARRLLARLTWTAPDGPAGDEG